LWVQSLNYNLTFHIKNPKKSLQNDI
jgi:hypothetical protein